MFYCFGCGVGGNIFSFLMKYHGLDFVEAVKTLADRAGIQIRTEKNVIPAEKGKEQANKRLYMINHLSGKFYHALLLRHKLGKEGRRYLKNRGITGEAVKDFMLGYAPEEWEILCSFLRKKGFTDQELVLSGVAQESKKGRIIDRFRNRVMFPICDYRGRIVGFGGRVLDTGEPKYLNTPDTMLFHKGEILYGLHLAIPEIRKNDFVIVVEGYTDVITAHQYGIKNVVASLGTAFTSEHGKILRRYTRNVVIAYDADIAGMAATIRGMDILVECGCKVGVVNFPEGKDPDDFIKTEGGEAFLELIKRKSLSLIEYKLQKACNDYDIDSISGKVAAVNDILPSLVKIENEVEREAYIKLVAERLALSQEAIRHEVFKHARKLQKSGINQDKIVKNKYTRERVKVPELPRFKGPEHVLVWSIILNPDFIDIVDQEIGIDSFTEPYLREILFAIKSKRDAGSEVTPSALMDKVSLNASRQFLTELLFKEYLPPCDNLKSVLLYINNIKCQRLTKQIRDKQAELAEAQKSGNNELQKTCLEEIRKLYKLREEYKNFCP